MQCLFSSFLTVFLCPTKHLQLHLFLASFLLILFSLQLKCLTVVDLALLHTVRRICTENSLQILCLLQTGVHWSTKTMTVSFLFPCRKYCQHVEISLGMLKLLDLCHLFLVCLLVFVLHLVQQKICSCQDFQRSLFACQLVASKYHSQPHANGQLAQCHHHPFRHLSHYPYFHHIHFLYSFQ